jgi:[acyl-carrier-protein] S-malonyltransferase
MPRIGLLFAGQGAQRVGMARDLYEEFEEAKALFHAAEEASGAELRQAMFEGPEGTLTRTDVSQLAVFLHSLALFRVLDGGGLTRGGIAGAAGLSLGEYTALCAAGVFTLEEGLRLVKRRGELMQEACEKREGAMASVLGLEEDVCRRACLGASEQTGRTVVVANLNSPGQVVISGDVEALEAASERLREAGAKRVVPLRVAGAFHSPLMAEAAVGLKAALGAVSFRESQFPVAMNVTGEPAGDAAAVPVLLEEQLTGTARFADCLRALVDLGAEELWELGPGKVLSGLARRTVGEIPSRSISTAADIKALAARLPCPEGGGQEG